MKISRLIRYEVLDSKCPNNLKKFGQKIGRDTKDEPEFIDSIQLHLYLQDVYSGIEYEPKAFDLNTTFKGRCMKSYLFEHLDNALQKKLPLNVQYDTDRSELIVTINVKPHPEFPDDILRLPATKL